MLCLSAAVYLLERTDAIVMRLAPPFFRGQWTNFLIFHKLLKVCVLSQRPDCLPSGSSLGGWTARSARAAPSAAQAARILVRRKVVRRCGRSVINPDQLHRHHIPILPNSRDIARPDFLEDALRGMEATAVLPAPVGPTISARNRRRIDKSAPRGRQNPHRRAW